MTLEKLILDCLWRPSNQYGATAASILRQVKPQHPRAKLSSISSRLVDLVRRGKLQRHHDFGPRGGYGYSLSWVERHSRPPRKTWFQVLKETD